MDWTRVIERPVRIRALSIELSTLPASPGTNESVMRYSARELNQSPRTRFNMLKRFRRLCFWDPPKCESRARYLPRVIFDNIIHRLIESALYHRCSLSAKLHNSSVSPIYNKVPISVFRAQLPFNVVIKMSNDINNIVEFPDREVTYISYPLNSVCQRNRPDLTFYRISVQKLPLALLF